MGRVAMAPKAKHPATERLEQQRSNDPVGMAAAEAAAARRLAAAAETAASAAEEEAAEAAKMAKEAAEAKALADKQLAEELARLRAQAPAVFSPEKTLRTGESSGWGRPPKPDVVVDVAPGGAVERDYRDEEIASLPKRSIKEIKARDREAQKAKDAAARSATATPSKATGSAPDGAASPAKAALAAPTVGGDAWSISQAKKAQSIKPAIRNKYNLMSAPESKASAKIDKSHFQVDSFEMSSAVDAKKHCQGALKKAHVGVKGTVGQTDYMLDHAVKSTKANGAAVLLAPKSTTHVGVSVKLPADEYLIRTFKEQQTAIAEANVAPMLPVPHLEAESWLSTHQKHAAQLAVEAHRQELPRSKGGVYPDAASAADGFSTPRGLRVEDAPITPVSHVLTELLADPTPPDPIPPPPVLKLW